MKEKIKIKGLKSQLKIMEGEAQALKIKLANIQKEYHLKLKIINEIKTEIDKFNLSNTIEISDHAIVRYTERVLGYDIDYIKKQILTTEIQELIETLGGNGNYPNKDFKVVVKNNTVVTIV